MRQKAACLLAGLTTSVALGAVGVGASTPAGTNEFTISQDTLRTGWDPNEPGLTPAQVSSSQ
ncbi:hypothetical protein, partial [Streptacidiphilus pinicola]|uniref:hypothetical protein n=1 Tax=Streptacidiphilus pinicola TaxID=2219663 RepID=UPI001057D3BE